MSLRDELDPRLKASLAPGGTGAFPASLSHSDSKPPVAVLILNHNGAGFLPACFESVLACDYPSFDVVLIDNASSDDSVPWTHATHPNVRIIQNQENMGFAAAYDRAIRRLDYPYLVLLNNDTTVHEMWLSALVAVAQSNGKIAVCGSRILMMHDRTTLDHGGGLFTWIGSGLDVGKWTRDRGGSMNPRETGFACGASLLMSRNAYLRVGGFDATYTMYHEDVDLCWRLRMAGYSIMHVPASVVYHHGGGGHGRGMDLHPSRTRFSQKNRLTNILKNMGPGRAPAALAVSSLYDLVRLTRLALAGNREVIGSIIGGYADFGSSLGYVLGKRRIIQRERLISDREMKPFLATLSGSMLAYWNILDHQRAHSKN